LYLLGAFKKQSLPSALGWYPSMQVHFLSASSLHVINSSPLTALQSLRSEHSSPGPEENFKHLANDELIVYISKSAFGYPANVVFYDAARHVVAHAVCRPLGFALDPGAKKGALGCFVAPIVVVVNFY